MDSKLSAYTEAKSIYKQHFLVFKSVLAGVPKGSVFGSLLFFIYMNEIADCLHSTARLFADDTSKLFIKLAGIN